MKFAPLPPTYEDLLLESAILILTKKDPATMKKSAAPKTAKTSKAKANNPFNLTPADVAADAQDEGTMNAETNPLDTDPDPRVQLGSTNSQEENTMSDAEYTETDFTAKEPTKQELAKAKAAEKIAAKAAKLQAVADKKAAALAAKEAKAFARAEKVASMATTTKEERETKKAERLARLAALDPEGKRNYVGSMLALADRVKQGAYVKAATGQLNCGDELASVLTAVPVDNVIRLAKIVLELPENPYTNLNTGQQSMNLRNRMRGALNKKVITIDQIRQVIADEGFATATDWAEKAAAKKADREAKAEQAKADKAAKAAAKAQAKEAVPA